jgi:VanZ family protein
MHILPGSVFPTLPSYLDLLSPDKLVHVAMFAVFFLLMIGGFREEGNPVFINRHSILTAFLCALLLGIVLELTQNYLIPNRFGSVYDLIADLAGCFGGWGLWWLIERYHIRTRRRID